MPSSAGVKRANRGRQPTRTSRRDIWGEDQLTTSAKSKLIDIDLVVRATSGSTISIEMRNHSVTMEDKLTIFIAAFLQPQGLGLS